MDHFRYEYERLEEKHRISETDRRKQELIYKHELESRTMKIESQYEHLEQLQEQLTHMEKVMEDEMAEVKEKIYEERRAKIDELDNDVKKLLLLHSESEIMRKARQNENVALRMIWNKESEKLEEEKAIQITLENDLDFLQKDVDQVEAQGNGAELEQERERLVKKIAKSKERIDYLYKERQKSMRKGRNYVQNEREVLDWEVEEIEMDIQGRREILEDHVNEMEAEEDIAADRLAEAEVAFGNKMAEEDKIIHAAQEQLCKHEEEVLNSLKEANDNLETKRVEFEEEAKQRLLKIAQERSAVKTLTESVEKLSGELQTKTDLEKSEGEKELQRVQGELESQENRLRELEERGISEEEKAEQLLAMSSRELKQMTAKREEPLEVERVQIEQLKEGKKEKTKEFEGMVNHLKETLEDARMKLRDDKQKQKDLVVEEEKLQQKVEDTIISIARKVSEKLLSDAKDAQNEVTLENLISEFEEVRDAGRVVVSQKEDAVKRELGKLDSSQKCLKDSVLEEEKVKERIEDDLKQRREEFLKDRKGEKMELIQFVENTEVGAMGFTPRVKG